MFLLELDGVVGLALLALWLYCLIDVIATDSGTCRHLPKMVWLVLVLLLPDVGAILWLVMGRPERAGWRPGDTTYRRPFSTRFVTRGPEDDPGFGGRSAPVVSPRTQPSSTPPPEAEAPDRRKELQAREDDLRLRELDAWEADLKRREELLRGTSPGEDPDSSDDT